ncbi:MAG: HIRAN domain-containing protein [Candidatus Omnitrophica bacterium]|nr:HIRAN domain-containing protein [Candidatus Omnitrophota bacterium]
MRSSSNPHEKQAGEIRTHIAGMQYVRGKARPGEKVYLEREPDNPHDSFAIRIKNLDFEDVGFIPRRISCWLAALIDQGKIIIGAEIPLQDREDPQDRRGGHPLILKIYIADKGRSIFSPNPSPKTDVEALQEAVRILFDNLHGFENPDIISGLEKRLLPVLRRDVTPETHLMLHLFSSQGEEIRNRHGKKVRKKIQQALSSLQLGEPIHYRSLTLHPIFCNGSAGADYILLKTAIESELAIVEEVSDQGRVNELMLHNQANKPLLIPEGEILIGAKQNRVVNISLIAAAHSSLRIPVSCVERERWRFTSKTFQSAHYASPKLRAQKLRSVQRCRRDSGAAYSDQGAVWEEISSNLREMNAHSSTESITDGYQKSKERIREYRDKFILPEKAVGVLAASGDRIMGMDCFDSPQSFRQCWARLSESYFIDAIQNQEDEISSREVVSQFWTHLPESIDLCQRSIGLGHELIARDQEFAGSGVWYADSLCHLSIFRVQ